MKHDSGRNSRRERDDSGDQGNGLDDGSGIVTRSIDGNGTNPDYPDWGAVEQTLLRLGPASYADGIGEMVGDRPNPREISNAVVQQTEDVPNSFGVSDLFWAWGQFIDHDLSLTEGGDTEFAPIVVPADDPVFSGSAEGPAIVPFNRAHPVEGSGEDGPREYANEITAFLDASMVYGSHAELAASLPGEGAYLHMADSGLLETTGNEVLAGEVRAAENVALTSLHTLFAREHNRWVEKLSAEHPEWTDDQLFDAARMRVEAEIQAITYKEFLPILVGEGAIAAYDGYDPEVNPGISVEFSTAAFRFGHSLLSSGIERLNEDGSEISAGAIALRDAFFNPAAIGENGGIDPILRGLAGSTAQELDTQIVEDVRSFLFAEGGETGLDLAALNIQRGRDLGVGSYNDLREALGLERAASFSDITSDPELAAALEGVYGSIDDVDAWIGGLAEDAFGGGMLGELFATIIVDQFTRVRDGDPYWSQAGALPEKEVAKLWDTTLADIIEANTDIESIQDSVLYAYQRTAGTEEADTLEGDDGRDLILGLAGDDTLTGHGGDDQIEGGKGADLIDGGAGNDLLYGGAGADTFFFGVGDGHDTIADFDKADSVLFDLSGFAEDSLPDPIQDGKDVLLEFDEAASLTWLDARVSDVEDGLLIA